MKGSCHPAFLSLPGMEPFDFSARARLRATHNGKVFWPVFFAVSRAVFVHGHIKHPMQAVFNGPMGAGNSKETLGREGRAQQIIAALCGGFSLFLACRNDLADRLQAGPVMACIQPIQVMTYQGPARFNTPMMGMANYQCGYSLYCRLSSATHRCCHP